jgi:hypothetical protein
MPVAKCSYLQAFVALEKRTNFILSQGKQSIFRGLYSPCTAGHFSKVHKYPPKLQLYYK